MICVRPVGGVYSLSGVFKGGKSAQVLFFADNEAARLGLVRGYSPSLPSLRLIMSCLSFVLEHELSSWYVRVPTCTNVAHGSSRLSSVEAASLLGARVVAPAALENGLLSSCTVA